MTVLAEQFFLVFCAICRVQGFVAHTCKFRVIGGTVKGTYAMSGLSLGLLRSFEHHHHHPLTTFETGLVVFVASSDAFLGSVHRFAAFGTFGGFNGRERHFDFFKIRQLFYLVT